MPRAISVAPRLRASAVSFVAFRHRLRKIGENAFIVQRNNVNMPEALRQVVSDELFHFCDSQFNYPHIWVLAHSAR